MSAGRLVVKLKRSVNQTNVQRSWLKRCNMPRFEQLLTLLETNSCGCRLQVSIFALSRDNVVSNDKFSNFLLENFLFRIRHATLHDDMVTKVNFFDDCTGV